MCETEGCNDKVRARNLCQYHYNRSMRHRYKHTQGIKNEKPHRKTLEEQKEFNEGLWEFVKKELRIAC